MTDERDTDLPAGREKLPTVSEQSKEAAKKIASEGWGMAKRLGGFLKQKAEEKFDDTRQRLNEPQLTPEELATIKRYRSLEPYLPKDHLSGHPPLPTENMLNRREIRLFLASPKLPDFFALGEINLAKAEADRIEAEAQAAAERVRDLEEAIVDIDKFYSNTLNEITIRVPQLQRILPADAISQAGDLAFEGSRSAIDKNWLGSPQDLTDIGGGFLYKAVRKGSARGNRRIRKKSYAKLTVFS